MTALSDDSDIHLTHTVSFRNFQSLATVAFSCMLLAMQDVAGIFQEYGALS